MRVLIVDHDTDFLKSVLPDVERDYVVDVAYSGVDGAYLSQVNDYDVLVVSADLSDLRGSEVCKMTREAEVETPIIVTSQNRCRDSKIACYESGADVVVEKPLDGKEINAQIRALVARCNNARNHKVIGSGTLSLNLKTKEVLLGDQRIFLRRKEYELLEYLIVNKNRVVSKEELLEHVWEVGLDIRSNTLEVQLRNLRQRIEKPGSCKFIKNIRNFGYVIRDFGIINT